LGRRRRQLRGCRKGPGNGRPAAEAMSKPFYKDGEFCLRCFLLFAFTAASLFLLGMLVWKTMKVYELPHTFSGKCECAIG
jgi:hypothetical protein